MLVAAANQRRTCWSSPESHTFPWESWDLKEKLAGDPSLSPSLPPGMCFPKICSGFVLMWVWFELAPVSINPVPN